MEEKKKRKVNLQALILKFAPMEFGYKDHIMSLDIDMVRAIASIRTGLDMNEMERPTEMVVKIAIRTLTSDSVTSEEEAMGYFTRKKLQKLSNWEDWEKGEQKQLDQFYSQKMFGML